MNGRVTALVRTLAVALAPGRVNAIHPGIVGARTPTGRLATMRDIVAAVVFLLENPSVNGVNLEVDGGWLLL